MHSDICQHRQLIDIRVSSLEVVLTLFPQYDDTFLQDFLIILKNPEEMFPLYYMHSNVLNRLK